MRRNRNSQPISPVPGSCRPGTSASCMWPINGISFSSRVATCVGAPRQTGKAALAGGAVPGRAVDQHERQPVRLQSGAQIGRRIFIGRGELDGGEAGARRGFETVEKRHLGKQKADIGAEARHSRYTFNTSAPDAGSSSQAFTVIDNRV